MVGFVVGEVVFFDGIEFWNVCYEFIVYLKFVYRKVGSWGNYYWLLVGVMFGNFFIYLEEVVVVFLDCIFFVFLNGVGKVEIDCVVLWADVKFGIDVFFSSMGSDVLGCEVIKGWVVVF